MTGKSLWCWEGGKLIYGRFKLKRGRGRIYGEEEVTCSLIVGLCKANPGSTVNPLAFRFPEDPLPEQEGQKTSSGIPEARSKAT